MQYQERNHGHLAARHAHKLLATLMYAPPVAPSVAPIGVAQGIGLPVKSYENPGSRTDFALPEGLRCSASNVPGMFDLFAGRSGPNPGSRIFFSFTFLGSESVAVLLKPPGPAVGLWA